MEKILIFFMSCLFFTACELIKEDDDDDKPAPAVDNTQYITCSGGNTCIDYSSTNFTVAQVKQACDDSGTTASDEACPTTYNGSASTGVCQVTTSGVQFNYRLYYGTVDAPETATEQTACTALGTQADTSSAWVGDSFTEAGIGTFYCRYDNKCQRITKTNQENALQICDNVYGYLDLNCE